MTQQTSVHTFKPEQWGSTLNLELQRTDAAWTVRLRSAVCSRLDCALIAEVGGRPSGLVWATADASDPGTVNLFQMWVAPEARGRAVGNALLQAAIL
jgi:ribosomal protein S18 acetylase RimI-like enzyme